MFVSPGIYRECRTTERGEEGVFCAVSTFLSRVSNLIVSSSTSGPRQKTKNAFPPATRSVKVDVSSSDRSIVVMDENNIRRSARRLLLNKKNRGRDWESIPAAAAAAAVTIDRLEDYQRSMYCCSYNFGFSSWLHRRRILTKALCRVTIRFIFMHLFIYLVS